jgi:hypothetical protein
MAMVKQFARYVGWLFALQVVMNGLAYMVFDAYWLSIPLAVGFLGLVWAAGRSLPGDLDGDRYRPTAGRKVVHALFALAVGLVWQLPGLLAPIRFIREQIGVSQYDGLSDLLDFLAESWHMILLPIYTRLPPATVDGYHALYYILLLASSAVLILLLAVAALWPRRRRWP